MGLFNKNSVVYERNTQIAELETKLTELETKNASLKTKLSDARAEIAGLKSTLTAEENDTRMYKDSLDRMRTDYEALRVERDALKEGAVTIAPSKDESERVNKAMLEKYALELKRLKLFSAKWQAHFVEKPEFEKQELVNLLKDILADSDTVQFILEAKERTETIMHKIGEPFDAQAKIAEHFDESESFNIDEALSADGLDLEELCKELGVFKG